MNIPVTYWHEIQSVPIADTYEVTYRLEVINLGGEL